MDRFCHIVNGIIRMAKSSGNFIRMAKSSGEIISRRYLQTATTSEGITAPTAFFQPWTPKWSYCPKIAYYRQLGADFNKRCLKMMLRPLGARLYIPLNKIDGQNIFMPGGRGLCPESRWELRVWPCYFPGRTGLKGLSLSQPTPSGPV